MGGREGGSLAVRVGGEGNVSESHVVWTGKDRIGIGTPLVSRGPHLLAIERRGQLRECRDGRTRLPVTTHKLRARGGKRVAEAPASRAVARRGGFGGGGRGQDYSSPVAADGKLYFISRSGVATVLADWATNSSNWPVTRSPRGTNSSAPLRPSARGKCSYDRIAGCIASRRRNPRNRCSTGGRQVELVRVCQPHRRFLVYPLNLGCLVAGRASEVVVSLTRAPQSSGASGCPARRPESPARRRADEPADRLFDDDPPLTLAPIDPEADAARQRIRTAERPPRTPDRPPVHRRLPGNSRWRNCSWRTPSWPSFSPCARSLLRACWQEPWVWLRFRCSRS